MSTHTLHVEGMACDGCEANVTDVLGAIEGIDSIVADHEQDQVEVEATAAVDRAAITEAIEDAGYDVIG